MAKVGLELVGTDAAIQRKINRALKSELDRFMTRATNKMVVPIRRKVEEAINNQPEVRSLEGGRLAGEFGLRDGRSSIQQIIHIWTNNIVVKPRKAFVRNGMLATGFTISMIKRDYSDVLADSSASVITEKGVTLPWLEWLLTFGDKVIIRDFSVNMHPGRLKRSRSGKAVMVKDQGSRWKVPAEFAGTPQKNFVTRALDSIEADVIDIIQKNLKV